MIVTLRVEDGEVAYETRFTALVLDECYLDLLHSAYEHMRGKVEREITNRREIANRNWIQGSQRPESFCPFDHYPKPCPVHS